MPVPAAPRPRATSHHGSRRRTGVIASFREPIPGWEAKGDNTRKKPVRHWTYWTHGEQPRRAVSPPTASTARLNQARASAEPRDEKAAAPFTKPVTKRSSSSAAAASIERRAPDAPAPVEESSIAAATRLRRAASVDAAARVHAAAAKTQAALKTRAHSSSVGIVEQPAPRRKARPNVVKCASETAPFAAVLMPGAPTPKAESRELGDFYADRRPHATRLMESLLAGSKLAAAERAARPSLRRNPNAQARPGGVGVAACLGGAC